MHNKPGLFGLTNTNRDFSLADSWGKNQFNSSFPTALCCYLFSKNFNANYLCLTDGLFDQSFIPIDKVFNTHPEDPNAYFAFEAQHTPYQKYVVGDLPRTDLVIQNKAGNCLAGLEIKLTALPDNTTHHLNQDSYGSEIVVRPDSIVYLACSLASNLQNELTDYMPDIQIDDWTDAHQVLNKIDMIVDFIRRISFVLSEKQRPFLIQPIWKTVGKSSELAENCLDVFVWSNVGFCFFISEIADRNPNANKITRQTRTVIWLFKMLLDFKKYGRFHHKQIIDELTYNTKNDKAFASAGNVTNAFMKCPRLIQPIVGRNEIKKIILGGGQNLLSPERRFDAILVNSPGIFE